jgi:hypothetical protein
LNGIPSEASTDEDRQVSDQVGDLIARFRNALITGQESNAKIDCLMELIRFDDPRIDGFLVDVAGSADEYDLARIQALKVLEQRAVETGARDDVVRMISGVLEHEGDDEIRSYAARALAGFIDVRGALDIAAGLVLDPNEDDDVRHNAFFAIERSKPTPQAIAAMKRCREEAKFSSGASRVLRFWGI